MVLNDAGKIANNEWLRTPGLRNNIELDTFIIMPNHMHAIIVITENDIDSRGVLHTPSDNGTSNEKGVLHAPVDININEKDVCNTSLQTIHGLRSPSKTIGAIVRGYKSSVTKQMNQLQGGEYPVWQRNYHDHIIRNEQSYQTISNYIVNNPAKWNNDKFYIP